MATTEEQLPFEYTSRMIKATFYRVKAKHIEGTQLCSIELPCKYKDKELTIVVYE